MAKSPETLTAQIQGLSGTRRDLNQLHGVLKSSEEFFKRSNYDVLTSIIHQLDPSQHSLGYLYLVDACSLRKQTAEVALLISRFIELCDSDQISLAAGKFIAVCRRLNDYATRVQDPILGVGPMTTAVWKLRSSFPETLTSLHPDALLLCVLAKCYKAGFSLLEDDDVYEVDKPKDFLLYCYYGGMVCIGQKEFGKGSELLLKAVTSPTKSLSAISVEAYKKYILVSLIQSGKVSSKLPKYSSSGTLNYLKKLSELYVDFANKYVNGKVSVMESFVRENRWKFEDDGNLGLANQAVSSMYKHSIQRLTKTYLTLSLEDIGERVGLKSGKEAEMLVLRMIQDGEIYAAINQKDGMVSFLEDPEQYKTCGMVDQMDSSIQRIMALSKKLTKMDESMACDPMYLKKKFGGERDHGEYGMHMDDYGYEEAMHFGNGRGFGRDRRSMRNGPYGFRM